MSLEDEAKAAAAAEVTKTRGWLARNWYPYSIGFVSCAAVVTVLKWVLHLL